MNNESFNKYIEQAIKKNWERIALSDFDGVSCLLYTSDAADE